MTRATVWRTSSFSGGENNECVQVANTLDALRDSKDPTGGTLRADLQPLLDAVKTDRVTR